MLTQKYTMYLTMVWIRPTNVARRRWVSSAGARRGEQQPADQDPDDLDQHAGGQEHRDHPDQQRAVRRERRERLEPVDEQRRHRHVHDGLDAALDDRQQPPQRGVVLLQLGALVLVLPAREHALGQEVRQHHQRATTGEQEQHVHGGEQEPLHSGPGRWNVPAARPSSA